MPANPEPTKPDLRTRKLLAGECLYSGCHARAAAGTAGDAYCLACADKVKLGKAKWAAKQRARLRSARLCLGCSKPSKRARCKGCAAEHAEWRDRRGVESGSGGVESGSTERRRGFTKVEHGDGYRAERYVGRERRGAPSRADLDEDLRSDLADAERELHAVRTKGIALLRSTAVVELGTIQRKEAQRQVADRLLRAARTAAAVAEALCKGRAAELERERALAVDE